MSKKYYTLILDGRERSVQNIDIHTRSQFLALYYNYQINIRFYPSRQILHCIAPAGNNILTVIIRNPAVRYTMDEAIEKCVKAIISNYQKRLS